MSNVESGVVRTVLHSGAGGQGLVRCLVEMPAGSRFTGTAGAGGELWFVIAGTGQMESDGAPALPGSPGLPVGSGLPGSPGLPVRPDSALWLPPGTPYFLQADSEEVVRLDTVSLPAAAAGAVGQDGGAAGSDVSAAGQDGSTVGQDGSAAGQDGSAVSQGEGAVGQDGVAGPADGAPVARLSQLSDCPVEVTGDRRFRVLFGPGRGCSAATQFVGEIPPGRAPAHTHPYDEVVLILGGEGVLHAGPTDHPLAPGSCMHLPPGQPHCLENTGQATLRVLGVFHPGGSPAAKREQ